MILPNACNLSFEEMIFHVSIDCIQNVFTCKNPRCITVTEKYIKPNFLLVDKVNGLYRCEYCDTLYKAGEDNNSVD